MKDLCSNVAHVRLHITWTVLNVRSLLLLVGSVQTVCLDGGRYMVKLSGPNLAPIGECDLVNTVYVLYILLTT